MLARVIGTATCPSVRLSVTPRYCVKKIWQISNPFVTARWWVLDISHAMLAYSILKNFQGHGQGPRGKSATLHTSISYTIRLCTDCKTLKRTLQLWYRQSRVWETLTDKVHRQVWSSRSGTLHRDRCIVRSHVPAACERHRHWDWLTSCVSRDDSACVYIVGESRCQTIIRRDRLLVANNRSSKHSTTTKG